MRHLEDVARKRQGESEERRIDGLSLTTYRDLAFNGLFYVKCGFVEIPADQIVEVVGTRGKELWDEEQAKIMSPERRCWMIKRLD
jgi:hypothetical protein